MSLSPSIKCLLQPAGLAMAMLLSPPLAFGQTTDGVVKNASLQFITGDDGKDDSDVFTLAVANAGGRFLERVFDAKEEIKPGTTFNLWLNRLRPEPQTQVANSRISFRIDPHGDEHWVVKEARLTVNYESGPAEHWHWGPFVLQTKNSVPFSVEFTLSDDHRF